MAQTPPPHNSDAPIPLCGTASAYELGIWHGPGTAPPPQGVQTERSAERHRRRRWLPQRRQKQSDQHAQTVQGASSCFSGLNRSSILIRAHRRGEGVCRRSAAGTHEGLAVGSTRARPADRRLARCHI